MRQLVHQCEAYGSTGDTWLPAWADCHPVAAEPQAEGVGCRGAQSFRLVIIRAAGGRVSVGAISRWPTALTRDFGLAPEVHGIARMACEDDESRLTLAPARRGTDMPTARIPGSLHPRSPSRDRAGIAVGHGGGAGSSRPTSMSQSGNGDHMSAKTKASAASGIRPFTIEIPEADLEDLRARIAATRWPERETVADQSQGVQSETMQELARYWATDYDWRNVRGEAERPAAVHDRDRRPRHPLHPRPFAARERAAAHHHARLARLGHRDAQRRRSAHRPDGARRQRRRTRSIW